MTSQQAFKFVWYFYVPSVSGSDGIFHTIKVGLTMEWFYKNSENIIIIQR